MKNDPDEDMAESSNGHAETRAVLSQGLDPAQFRDAMSCVAAAGHIVTPNGPAGLADNLSYAHRKYGTV